MVTLTNVGTSYDAIAASKGLGIGLIDFTGATSLQFVVKVNKVGNGTQSWQLWNDTDGIEIAVMTDTGSTGDKVLDQTFAVNLTGVKMVRVRAKSTTNADDPVFYGAAVLLT